MDYKIKRGRLIIFTFAFIAFTIVGTVSHEYGHIIAAKYLGYETKLHYASMDWNAEEFKKQYEILYLENEDDILANQPFPDRQRMEEMSRKHKNDTFIITMAGPLQTIITGSLGLLLLLGRRTIRQKTGFKAPDWMGIFMSLFWIREILNLIMSVMRKLITGKDSFFGGDEMRLSLMLDLPAGTISIIIAVLGLIISCLIIFRIVPKSDRLTFIISGCLGGLAGFYFWMYWLGPVLLP